LADRLTVMVDGRVIASDLPEVIRADASVRRAYLGQLEVVASADIRTRSQVPSWLLFGVLVLFDTDQNERPLSL
jgi:ABC-type hemin transport system ATPase subunit